MRRAWGLSTPFVPQGVPPPPSAPPLRAAPGRGTLSLPGPTKEPRMRAAAVTLALLALAAPAGAADFALRDGDTVVFLGDSITAARTYGKIVENYTLLRFPERKVRFANAGWGGDTAAGGL